MSYIEANCQDVIDACDRYLVSLREKIKEEQEIYIVREMLGGWLSRPKTREQAIDDLESCKIGDSLSGYHTAKWTCGRERNQIEKLKALAEIGLMNSGKVMVDADVARALVQFWNKPRVKVTYET